MATKFEVINVDFDDLFEPVRAGFNSVEFDRKYLAPQNMTGPMKYMAIIGDDEKDPDYGYKYTTDGGTTWLSFKAHPKGVKVPKKLVVSGEWSNTQWSNIEPDITGLTLTVTWQDGTTQDVTSSVVVKVGSSTKWSTASGSTQTATFTYIHHGITVTTTKDAIPIRKLISFACTTQTWSNYQFYGDAPTTDGLKFTATYSNGTTAAITPELKEPSTWATGTAAQTSTVQNATFGYTQDGVTAADITVGATVYRKVTTLEVSGSWSNTQWTNIAPDITGLVFKATFNNGATIDPVAHTSIIVSPNTWNGTVGEQEATFTFAERGATAQCTKKADVKRKLSSLSITGDWSNYQFYGEIPDTTGLTFTANYNNGTSQAVTPTVKVGTRTTWAVGSASEVSNTQTATFSYSENGVTVSNTKDATVYRMLTRFAKTGGSWGYQYYDTAVNYSGLVFTAYYNNNSSATITPDLDSPSKWETGSSSENYNTQTAKFSYSERGVSASEVNVDATVYKKLTEFTVGSFSAYQYYNEAVNVTGMQFLAKYNNGSQDSGYISDYSSMISVSPGTWTATGSQAAKFTCSKYDISLDYNVNATVYRVVTSLRVTGEWSNTQWTNVQADIAGLKFYANFNNGDTNVEVTPTSISTWKATEGSQTATFTYTEHGRSASTTKGATVYRRLDSLTVGGSWSNYQFYKDAPDTTGLTFTANYNNGTTATVTPSKDVSTWTSYSTESHDQDITFSYSERGVSAAGVTKSVTVYRKLVSFAKTSGDWSGWQFYGDAPSYSFVFTATYNNNNTATITPTIKVDSGTTWAIGSSSEDSKTQAATFSYSERGISVANVNIDATTYKKLSSIAITGGSWSGYQHYGDAPTYSYTFKAVYNNNSEATGITPSVSPNSWAIGSSSEEYNTQAATFSYSNRGITASVAENATVYRKLTSLTVSGNWSNYQYYNYAPDTTGLTFTAKYNNNTSETVTPSADAWGGTGTQTATFSYTKYGISQTTTKTATVYAVLTSLEVSGDWSNIQYYGYAPDTTGLTFIAHFNTGSTSTVAPSVSPSIWQNTGPQTATFSYDYYGKTASVDKNAVVFVGIISDTFRADTNITSLNFT